MSYYVSQSAYSDPGDFLSLYSVFPKDIRYICQCVHNLFLHYADVDIFNTTISESQYAELNFRFLKAILFRLISKNNALLIFPRDANDRVIGICRDSSLLVCSILRHFGLQARLRSGYVTYFIPGLYLDGCVVEFYDPLLKRWRLVDTRTSQRQIDAYHLNVDFDLTDVPRDKFISAAAAWKLCVNGEADPSRFGSRQRRGLDVVRNRLIQDLALLNKQELLVWDLWGEMLCPLEDNYLLTDNLAEIMIEHENDTNFIRAYYQNQKTLRVPDHIFVDPPFIDSYWQKLEN